MNRTEEFIQQMQLRMDKEIGRRVKAEAAIAGLRALLRNEPEISLADAMKLVDLFYLNSQQGANIDARK